MIELLQTSALRETTPSATGSVKVYVKYTPNGGEPSLLLESRFLDSEPGAQRSDAVPCSLIMVAGDKIEGYTYDESDGGVCLYTLLYKGTEFDA
jgi:hypothetical protein